MLTSVPVFLSDPDFTLLRREILSGPWRRLRRVLGLCYRGRPLQGCGAWLSGGFCIFWRGWLGVRVVLVESRLGLDDHGEMIEASGLH